MILILFDIDDDNDHDGDHFDDDYGDDVDDDGYGDDYDIYIMTECLYVSNEKVTTSWIVGDDDIYMPKLPFC